MGLSEVIGNPAVKDSIVADCTKLIDQQVATKQGFAGIALKATYGVVKGLGANYIPGAISRLLPEAFVALDPMWKEGTVTGDPANYLIQNSARTADMILSVTDSRAAKTSNGAVRSAYQKLRKSVKGDVEAAVPGLANILATHVAASQANVSL
jgi:hypothetical protein